MGTVLSKIVGALFVYFLFFCICKTELTCRYVSVPDFNFSGRLSSVCASLDYSQYCFILGMLGENLGEPLEEFERPSSVIQDPLGKVL